MAATTDLVVRVDQFVVELESQGYKFDDILDAMLDYVELDTELNQSADVS